MKVRTKEEMRLYRRELRARHRSVTPVVTPSVIEALNLVTPLSHPIETVTPKPDIVTPCTGCLERDIQIKKLTVRIAFLEKSMERYADIDTRARNPKKFGGDWL